MIGWVVKTNPVRVVLLNSICKLLILSVLYIDMSFAAPARENDKIVESVIGSNAVEKFAYHKPTYLIGGIDDLKLQFSFKYRIIKTANLYFAYTQLMLWSIYEATKPFADVNYYPEIFYRFLERNGDFLLRNIDLGYLHSSNGQDGEGSRAFDRLYLRSNFAIKVNRNVYGMQLMAFHIFNKDDTNPDIIDHYGYYTADFFVTDIIKFDHHHLDFELKFFSGKRVYDFDQGGHQVGVIYRSASQELSPSFYFQHYEGFSENLEKYNKRRTEYRIGFLLSI